jgi:hypothetical protein
VLSIYGRIALVTKRGATEGFFLMGGIPFRRVELVHGAKNFEDSLAMAIGRGGRMMTDTEASLMMRLRPSILRSLFAAQNQKIKEFWVFSPSHDTLPSVQKLGFTCNVEMGRVDSCMRTCPLPVLIVYT